MADTKAGISPYGSVSYSIFGIRLAASGMSDFDQNVYFPFLNPFASSSDHRLAHRSLILVDLPSWLEMEALWMAGSLILGFSLSSNLRFAGRRDCTLKRI